METDGQFSAKEAHNSLRSITWLIDVAKNVKPKTEYEEQKQLQALRMLDRLEDETIRFIEEMSNN